MANPRRISVVQLQNVAGEQAMPPLQISAPSRISSAMLFLKKPQAFPFLLSLFVLLTWVSLRFHHPRPGYVSPFATDSSSLMSSHSGSVDLAANLVRFSSVEFPSQFFKDKRGWLVDPVSAAKAAGLAEGARPCASVHVGEIRPGRMRGNHRHRGCNETFIFWGATTKFRLENPRLERGYAEVSIGVDEVAIAVSPSGIAHAIINIDSLRTTFFLGCLDSLISYNDSTTDFRVWKDL
ncbi:rmlC-type cupin [Wolffia australiana]